PPPVDKEPPPVDKEPPPVDKEPPPVDKEPDPTCGAGTELVNGICQVIRDQEPEATGGGCLIATAAYGTELAPQVQFLREIRDNTVMSTESGAAFMTGFNQLYYSFSPIIADMERENPMFQEVVRAFITPMVSSLSIMTLAEDGSEVEVLGLGISVIALNLGMYIAAPALIGFKVHNHFKSRK
ncbi:MAG: CFI-box-CTERM domain-containing protein, partial [Nitrosopumilus sp.]